MIKIEYKTINCEITNDNIEKTSIKINSFQDLKNLNLNCFGDKFGEYAIGNIIIDHKGYNGGTFGMSFCHTLFNLSAYLKRQIKNMIYYNSIQNYLD